MASQEGKLDLIKYLIEIKKLDCSVLSKINENKKEVESNLEVASRWGHRDVVKYYLNITNNNNSSSDDMINRNYNNYLNYNLNIRFSKEIIKNSIKVASNNEIKKYLTIYYNKIYKKTCGCL